MRQISNDFKEAVFAAQTKEAFICLLTLSHPSFDEDITLASDSMELLPVSGQRGVLSNGIEYIYLPFDINLPSQDESGIAKCNISIDNIDRQIVKAVRSANSEVTVKFAVIKASNPDYEEVTMEDFQLKKANYDALTVSGEISVEYFDLEPFPTGRFTPSTHPGMF